MRDDPLLLAPTLHPPRLHLEPLNSMERPASLERAHALQILALEPEPQDRSGGRPALPPRAAKVLGGAGRRRELRQRAVRQHGRAVDMRLDQLVGLDDRVAC